MTPAEVEALAELVGKLQSLRRAADEEVSVSRYAACRDYDSALAEHGDEMIDGLSSLLETARAYHRLEQELADVRTLDEWRASLPGLDWHMTGSDGWSWCRLYWGDDLAGRRGFDGPTPDAARHAAAEWVRSQKEIP